jgi:dTMP kinase
VFVTLEGIGGAGKTTQAALLRERLESEGRKVLVTREPGGTALGEQIRELLLSGEDTAPWAEAALFAAARAELVARVIAPALAHGAVVICDRYLDSSLAYQGIARGLGVDRVLQLNLPAVGDHLPDRTYLLLIDPEESARRIGGDRDRIERENGDFRRKVDRAYRELAETFPQRIESFDGMRPPDEISKEIFGRLRDRL